MSRPMTFFALASPLIFVSIAARDTETSLGIRSIAVTGSISYICILALWAIFKVFVYPFVFSPLRHLPEPTGAGWLWAHAKQIRQQHNGEPFRTWIHHVPNSGLIRYRVLFNEERVFLTSTDALREVLVTNSYEYRKSAQATVIFRKLLGDGLLVASGEEHKRQRKLLMPAFSFRHIKDLYPVFWTKARKSTDAIAAAINAPNIPGQQSPQVQSTYDWASRVTLDIIGVAGMGYDFNAIEEPYGELYTAYHDLFLKEPPFFRWIMIGIWVPFEWFFSSPMRSIRFALFPQMRDKVKKIRAVADELISQKRALAQERGVVGADILSVAMESGKLSDEDLASQIMTFLAAGHATTASALTWTTYLLCTHPDVQVRLREEIRNRLTLDGDLDSSADALKVDHLPYLNAVCNEVLRFMPSVPMTMKLSDHDTMIQGQLIPKGTIVTTSSWAVNTSKDLWGEDALEFNPDRWLGDGKASNSGGALNNFANLTFSHGPRSCIGKDFARSELLCLMAAWFGRFDVELEIPELGKGMIGWVTLRPGHGLPVRFREVDR